MWVCGWVGWRWRARMLTKQLPRTSKSATAPTVKLVARQVHHAQGVEGADAVPVGQHPAVHTADGGHESIAKWAPGAPPASLLGLQQAVRAPAQAKCRCRAALGVPDSARAPLTRSGHCLPG